MESNIYIVLFAVVLLLILVVIAVVASLKKHDAVNNSLNNNANNANANANNANNTVAAAGTKEGFTGGMPHGTVIYAFHSLAIGPLLVYTGVSQRNTPMWVFQLLLILGIAVIFYHLYKLVLAYKREGFLRSNYYMPRSAINEPFVPFSYPYMEETDKYYSFHDPEHTRGHNCVMNTESCPNGRINLPEDADGLFRSLTAKSAKVPAMVMPTPVEPATTSDYGMTPQVPVMGRNPMNHVGAAF
jgi:hypothetical protein